jgi:hypothetical protein
MEGETPVVRRQFLRLTGGLVAVGLAGCSGDPRDSGSYASTQTPTVADPTPTPADLPGGSDQPAPPLDPPADPGPPDIDPGAFSTYTNDTFDASIDYPGHWEVDDRNPFNVRFSAPEEGAAMYFRIADTEQTFDEIVAEVRASFEEAADADLLGDRETTLSSGQRGWIWDFSVTGSGDPFRGKGCVALVDGWAFTVAVGTLASRYTDEFDRQAAAIVESLAIA